jgi:mono/diheme cytochrome c family protein
MIASVSKPASALYVRISAAAVIFAATALPAFAADSGTAAQPDKVARGKYLVTIAGCNDCHTPWKPGPNGPAPDMTRMLSGHPETMALPPAPQLPPGPWLVTAAGTNTAWSGPWGVSFTANLTPDPETGLGRWTLRNFVDTIRSGRHMGRGRQILPPMPTPMYKHMTDGDLEAVYTYLRSIPAISNRVPEPLPPTAPSVASNR